MSEEIQKLGLFEDDKTIVDYPEKQQIDYLRDALKLPTSLIPTGSVVLDLVFASPISKRKDAWVKELGNQVQWLLDNGLSIEDLQNNEKFVDIVFQATQIAIKTSQKQKIDALKNAVVNTVLDDSYDASIIQMFLNLIDELTPLHFNILDNSKALSEFGVPRIEDQPQLNWLFLEKALKLYVNVDEIIIRSIFSRFAQQGIFLKVDRAILTDFGERFVGFIKEN